MSESNNTNVKLFSPSLPKGGGSITGMGESMAVSGSDGMAGFTIPLPATSGRYITPQLTLSYNSGNGNGSFGIGWQIGIPRISRRTSKGIPSYTSKDEFLGPDGEVLVPKYDQQGNPVTRQTDTAQGISLGETFIVTPYFSRNESSFNRIEYWEAMEGSMTPPFWLIHGSDGLLHCFGKTSGARITSLHEPAKIAEWLLEESLSPFGEHIYYEYKQEDNIGIDTQDNHEYGANRYIKYIRYGNKTALNSLYLWRNQIPSEEQWLYTLVLDYGEDHTPEELPPSFTPQGSWTVRQDCFSRFDYGFEIRTCRLCRQIFMFHHFQELGSDPFLVWRMLIEYDENPVVSMLSAVRHLAYEDGMMLDTPPLEFGYTEFEPDTSSEWKPFPATPEMADGQGYQIVDLYGEGIPGILYQSDKCWQYRSPVRDENGTSQDSVKYESFQPLSKLPVPDHGGVLVDINGDGYLEWMVTQPGFSGSYRMNLDKTWSHFIPLKALPTEFFHPKAQLNNVTGSPFMDLLMIGPKSVRFYAGEESGFKRGEEVLQDTGITLPFHETNERELVAFSDILGSGQQHLVRIRHDQVTCWPNIGLGVFGAPRDIAGFFIEEKDFNPERIYLADIDGTGTSDLLYACHDCILIYRNLSGNSFADPLQIPLPDGVYFDDLCRLYPGDVTGQGMSDLVLSVPYMQPRNWHFPLSERKPYLLKSIHNNLGVSREITYRSSAQYWLDEKKADPSAICALPLTLNIVSNVKTLDENTGNSQVQQYTYRRGVYDQQEKEFVGFGNIQVVDKQLNPQGEVLSNCPEVMTYTWYHTGRKEDEEIAGSEYWKGDSERYSLEKSRFTMFDEQLDKDFLLESPNEQQEYWLYRALKGMSLHVETYSKEENVPYHVQSNRYQIRLVQNTAPGFVVLPVQLEQLSYNYEQITSDPQCSQQINQYFDQYGFITQSIGIEYPRREKAEDTPYPDNLPDTSYTSSYDEQQMILRFTRGREKMYHLTNTDNWRLGIPHQTRADVFTYPASSVPSGGIGAEMLDHEGLLESEPEEQMYGGQREIIYTGETVPDIRAMVYYTCMAVMDETCLKAYEGILEEEDLSTRLAEAGLIQTPRLLGTSNEEDVYAAKQGFTYYADGDAFYRMTEQQSSLLTGKQSYTWDDNYCVITASEDVLGNKVQISYDYRFLQPDQITDFNRNVNQVKFDGLGRVTYTRMWGTEKGIPVGFDPEAEFTPPNTVEEALAMVSPLEVASSVVYDTNSWMGSITMEQLQGIANPEEWWTRLIEEHMILADGRIRAKGRNQVIIDKQLPSAVASLLANASRSPIHTAILSTDRYPDDSAQQIIASVTFSDGFGRSLQTSQRWEAGTAYVLDEYGNIVVDLAGKPVMLETDTRWTVTGRVLYDCRGVVVKDFQPFFLNDWNYADNESVDSVLYANTYDYDPLAREIRMINAKGYETRQGYFPWFMVSEDENDTDETLQYKGTPTITVIDNRNLPIRKLEYNRTADLVDEYITRSTYTLLGHLRSSMDPRLFRLAQTQENVFANITNISTLQGTVISTNNVDAGRSALILDAENRLFWSINGNDVQTSMTYDVIGRPVAVYEQKEEQLCRDRFVYGENEPNASAHNLLGKLVRHYDSGGLLSTESYSLSGLPLMQNRRLLTDIDNASNWQTEEESNWMALLDTNQYITNWEYNVMDQMISQTDAKENVQRTTFGVAGQMKGASLTIKGEPEQSIVNQVDYNASGQKLAVWAGNGTITQYTYEDTTQRLTDITTSRLTSGGGTEVLQALHYEYDPVGNVINADNLAESVRYFRNQRVTPKRSFEYDTLYRLISASGRESDAHRTYQSFPDVISPIPVDDSQYVNYSQNYKYDLGGNLTQIRHMGASSYTKDITISDRSNRGVWIQDGGSSNVDSYFDQAGNLIQLMPGVPLEWDTRNQLKNVNQVVREESENDRESYLYDSSGFRLVKRTIRQALNAVNTTTVLYLPGLEIRTKQTNSSVTESLQVMTAGEVRVLHWENNTQPNGIGNNQYRYGALDLIGSFMLELDQDGQLISKEEYYPFGGTAIWAARSEIEADYKTMRYSGKEMDATGLYYYGFRYYMPWVGRWLNADPAGTVDGLNLYSMVGNNPVTESDAYGLTRGRYNVMPKASTSKKSELSQGLQGTFRRMSESGQGATVRVPTPIPTESRTPTPIPTESQEATPVSTPVPSRRVSPNAPYSYIFHMLDKGWDRSINFNKDELQTAEKINVKLMKIDTSRDFKKHWNEMGTEQNQSVDIHTVMIFTHATPTTFDLEKETMLYFGNLENKSIRELLIIGCNAGHLDHRNNNIASIFAEKVKDAPVWASDGSVYNRGDLYGEPKYISSGDKEFNKHFSTRENNKGWHIYKYHNEKLHISNTFGVSLTMKEMLGISASYRAA